MDSRIASINAQLPLRLGRLDRTLSWRPPDSEKRSLLGVFQSISLPAEAGWMLDPESYDNVYEILLQYLVAACLTRPQPAIRMERAPDVGRVVVRVVPSPSLVMEVMQIGDAHAIVISTSSYKLPLHLGLAQSMISAAAREDDPEAVLPTDLLGGRGVESVLFSRLSDVQPILNSLWTSCMDAVRGMEPDQPEDFLRALDRENQEKFVEAMLVLLRSGGESPFDHGIAGAAMFFPAVFMLYGLMHELGHVILPASEPSRSLKSETGSDLIAAYLIDQLITTPGARVPVAVAAAAIFYATLSYLTQMTELNRFYGKKSVDIGRYYSDLENVLSEGRPLTHAAPESRREFHVLGSRAVGAAAFLQQACSFLFVRPDHISLFWYLRAELKMLTDAALDPDLGGSSPVEQHLAAFRADWMASSRKKLRPWLEAYIAASRRLFALAERRFGG